MPTARDVANYFLALADANADGDGEGITHLKLQKLVYYAQGFSLAAHGRPLFNEPLEAWQHGPVQPGLFAAYAQHGRAPIPAPGNFNFDLFTDDERLLLDDVFNVYGQYSAWKLRNMTHEEPPWQNAFQRANKTITHAEMRDYFRTLLV